MYPVERPLRLRIGVNLGDILVGGDGDIYGDGVNIAARLEQIAPPGGLCISGAVFDQIDGKLNLTFKNRGEQRVKNIARPVRIYDLDDEGSPQAGAAPVPLSIPDRPSVAVLPFTNASPDPDQDHFAQGIVEEVTAALSRVRSFFVISPSSTSAYKGKSVDPREESRVLGVRYVVEGSIRRSGSRLRVMARLIDAATGNHVWSERYDGEVSDIFDLQDRVAEAVVGAI